MARKDHKAVAVGFLKLRVVVLAQQHYHQFSQHNFTLLTTSCLLLFLLIFILGVALFCDLS